MKSIEIKKGKVEKEAIIKSREKRIG